MDSSDLSSAFSVPDSGSHLLSESFTHAQGHSRSHSHTSTSLDDLSLADLSLTDHPPRRPQPKFSLLAQPRFHDHNRDRTHDDESAIADDLDGDGDADADAEGHPLDQTLTPEEAEKARTLAAKTRTEKLESDLFVLRRLNAAFAVYRDALQETHSSTERVAEQLVHTNALLDKYVSLLSKSEKITKLILDERWAGADADEAQVEREAREEIERLRREREAREEAARRELERLAQERLAQEERDRLERERAESSRASARGSGSGSGSGVRGVRGTRASMRGVRGGATRTSSSVPRVSSPPTSVSASGGSGIRKPGSVSRGSVSSRASSVSRRGA